MREIRADLNTGWHMNRLLQGDVGSGKTMVALLTALLALDNGYKACVISRRSFGQPALRSSRGLNGPACAR